MKSLLKELERIQLLFWGIAIGGFATSIEDFWPKMIFGLLFFGLLFFGLMTKKKIIKNDK
jgi:hypothetical protein